MASNAKEKTRTDRQNKTAVYEALGGLNTSFRDLLQKLEELKALGVFRNQFQRESSEASRITLEETRAWINSMAAESLRDYEESDRARFGRLRHQFETKYKDPEDVLLAAARVRRPRPSKPK